MLKELNVIDECDTVAQGMEGSDAIYHVSFTYVHLNPRFRYDTPPPPPPTITSQYSYSCRTLVSPTLIDQYKALVTVYQDLLKFCVAANEILCTKHPILTLLGEQLRQRLSPIVTDFLDDARHLRDFIGIATARHAGEANRMLLDQESKLYLAFLGEE